LKIRLLDLKSELLEGLLILKLFFLCFIYKLFINSILRLEIKK